jgi:hypothetical protein
MVYLNLKQTGLIGHTTENDFYLRKTRHMNRIIFFFIILTLAGCNETGKNTSSQTVANDTSINRSSKVISLDFFSKYPLLTLLRKTPVEIGCILQTEFKYRDTVFNCDNKNYLNKGDPCKKTNEYYEGIIIPVGLSEKIHPDVKDMHLDFEHGSLRELTITFRDSLSIDKVRTMFNLPAENGNLPKNIISISFGENIYSKDKPADPNYTKWLTVTGFEHMGAGEADCK